MRNLESRTAIVTGASRGIGPYICRALAARGMNVVLAARNATTLAGVAAMLEARGVRAIAVPTDVSNSDGRARLVAAAIEAFGVVDVLVNNAAVEMSARFEDLSPDEILDIIGVNLTAPALLTHALLPGMIERRRGHIVNIASLAGMAPVPYNATYAATKAGLIGLTESLHAELRGTGVGASAICPGFVSEAGMFHNSGVHASRMTGVSRPASVAKAVVRAIESNYVNVIVNPVPIRPMLAVGALSPAVLQRLLPVFGVTKTARQMAAARRPAPPVR